MWPPRKHDAHAAARLPGTERRHLWQLEAQQEAPQQVQRALAVAVCQLSGGGRAGGGGIGGGPCRAGAAPRAQPRRRKRIQRQLQVGQAYGAAVAGVAHAVEEARLGCRWKEQAGGGRGGRARGGAWRAGER
jgi:hypothetical protein